MLKPHLFALPLLAMLVPMARADLGSFINSGGSASASSGPSVNTTATMKKLVICLLMLAGTLVAHAYEFHLQFTPISGARGLSVVGYYFSGETVVGNCSYYTVTSSGGRGAPSHTTHYNSTCTWDLYGNLLSTVSGAPSAPPPIGQSGDEIIYAQQGSGATATATGSDIRGYGFVSTPSAHITWTTPSGSHYVISDGPLSIPVSFVNDGDLPFDVSKMSLEAIPTGTATPTGGTASVTFSCSVMLAPGGGCTATVAYNPKSIKCTASPYGYAYTEFVMDAPEVTAFFDGFTVTGVRLCDGS